MDLDDLYRLLRVAHVQAQGIVDTIRDPLLVLSGDLTIISANPAFYRTFATDRDSTIGRPLYEPRQRPVEHRRTAPAARERDPEERVRRGLRNEDRVSERGFANPAGQRAASGSPGRWAARAPPLDRGCDGPAADGGRPGLPDQRASITGSRT